MPLITGPYELIGNSPFCSDHGCGLGCCSQCRGSADRPHLLYLHIEKTGGSSIECATQQTLVPQGIWTNMGHTWGSAVEDCKRRCPHHKVVVSIREPYSWWRSLFTYAFRCSWAAVCLPRGYPRTFAGFMDWARRNPKQAQSAHIHNACGDPCQYDYLLKTERLIADWINLVRREHLPLYKLPRINMASNRNSDQPRNQPPPTVFTEEILQIIHELDGPMFDEFGYARRTSAFELT